MKFTKSISRVSWPTINAASYQPRFFHNYLTLIALCKLKNKEKQKRKQLHKYGLAQVESTSDREKLYRSRLSSETTTPLMVIRFHEPQYIMGWYGVLCVVPIYFLP